MAPQLDAPNEEILEFYNNNQIMFFSEEQRSFKYLILRPEDYEAMKIQFDEWQKFLRTAPLTKVEKYSETFFPSRKVARTSSIN